MRNIVLTGGLGFIGSHLVDRLLKEDYQVSILDDFATGQIQNVARHEKDARLTISRASILDKPLVDKIVSDADAVVHLAALTSVVRSSKEPRLVHDVNVTGTLNLLECCIEHSVEKFVFISLAAVYGKRTSPRFSEDQSLNPLSLYASSKAAGEAYCEDYHDTHQLDAVVIRLMNVYGPRRSAGPYAGVMMNFAEAVEKKNPILIHGDGEQTRDFTYATDAAEAIFLALKHEQAAGEIFNVGTGIPCTVNRLAELFLKVSNSRLSTVHGPARKGDVRESFGDIAKAQSILGYHPKISLEDGLRFFLSWYRETFSTEPEENSLVNPKA